jgi:hypothetical protein
MKKILFLMVILVVSQDHLLAETPFTWGNENQLARRLDIQNAALSNMQESMSSDVSEPQPNQKSVGKAVLFSALLPGSGQFYAKSYIKTAVFLTAEVGAWAVNISYNKKGDDKDREFKQYAEEKWSEYRYWSYVNWDAQDNPDLINLLVPEQYIDMVPAPNGGTWYLINEQYFNANRETIISNLRQVEAEQYSHRLPETRTQQYYEMIGKYPMQFGNAWDDARFDYNYSGPDNITYNNNFYMDMREESNRLYNVAQNALMVVLINHVVSAVDAGFTTRNYNRRQLQMEMSYNNIRIKGEYLNMFGVNLKW